ncbi:MAG: endopeptidase La [Candidatus Electryonea clarkiae]|nr:endopeptidase La [Candidatus Electryonea clarkiae]MDP8286227.1 endopeptidase La [Candidatus Electryonea clarkiae]
MAEETKNQPLKIPDNLPVFPVRDQVIFPGMIFPLLVGREGTLRAIEAAMMGDRMLLLLAQKDAALDEVEIDDLFRTGIVAKIVQVLKLPNGLVKVLVEGLVRAKVDTPVEQDGYLSAQLETYDTTGDSDIRLEGAVRHAIGLFRDYIPLNRNLPDELLFSLDTIKDPQKIADFLASHIALPYDRKQRILEADSILDQLLEIAVQLSNEIEVLRVEKSIEGQVREKISHSQRTYFLQEQLRQIKRELGEEGEDDLSDIITYQRKLKENKLSKEAKAKVEEELEKLKSMPMLSPEATVVRNYVDWLLALPWQKKTRDRNDLERAAIILDEDHYGLNKPKERILEHLAVLQLVKKMRGPIICLVGPPGVGKTSLGRSIARAINRRFVRFSLGGIRDEAEIRGHRRTYIGSQPGRVIQMMKKAGVVNPVLLLDEIDKMSVDFRGDPASALLEVLDPEQNNSFSDNYLEVEYNLSQVMFITTANTRDGIPIALQDRMEIINLPGYLTEEKLQIAQLFLCPKQIKEHGLDENDVHFTKDALLYIIENHTREAGVREMERNIAKICRRVARKKVEGNGRKRIITRTIELKKMLGVATHRRTALNKKPLIGSTIGLAWTPVGGDILKVQVRVMPGKQKLTLTGQLGDVLKESAMAGLSYIRSQAVHLDIDAKYFQDSEIHVHLPEGAIPKDGPSAGITIATAMLSALTQRKVRGDLTMTGEITLQGDVLQVGGINEKIMAAQRNGMKTIILPAENKPEWEDRPKGVGKGLKVHFVENVDQVWELALLPE